MDCIVLHVVCRFATLFFDRSLGIPRGPSPIRRLPCRALHLSRFMSQLRPAERGGCLGGLRVPGFGALVWPGAVRGLGVEPMTGEIAEVSG